MDSSSRFVELMALALLVVSHTVPSNASTSILKAILQENQCNTLILHSKHLAFSWETATLPHAVLNSTFALSASFIKHFIGKSRSKCIVIFGHLSDVANMTALQSAVENVDHLTLYVFANSLASAPAYKTVKRPTVVVIEEPGSSGNHAMYLQCPMKGSLSLVNLWSPRSGFFKPIGSMNCNAYLNGHHITVATVGNYSQSPPFMKYNNSGQAVGGSEIDILRAASQSLNFTFELMYSPYYIFGYPGGGFGGIAGMVRNQTALFGVGPLRMTQTSYQAIDFAHYLYAYDYSVISPIPQPIVPITNLIEPFTGTVWIAVVATCLIITFCYFVWSWSPAYLDKNVDTFTAVMGALLEGFRTSLNQNHEYSTTENPPSKSTMVIFWFIGDFFIKSFYTSLLLTYLLTTNYEKPVNTLEDVYFQGRPLFFLAGTQLFNNLALSSNPVQRALAEQAITYNRFKPTDITAVDLRDMLRQRGCYLENVWNFYGYSSARLAGLLGYYAWRASPVVAMSYYGSYITPKHAVYNDELRRFLMHIPDSGLTTYFFRRYIPLQYMYPAKEEDRPPPPLTFMHFLGAFAILACFGVLATLIFVAEVFKGKREKVPQPQLWSM